MLRLVTNAVPSAPRRLSSLDEIFQGLKIVGAANVPIRISLAQDSDGGIRILASPSVPGASTGPVSAAQPYCVCATAEGGQDEQRRSRPRPK